MTDAVLPAASTASVQPINSVPTREYAAGGAHLAWLPNLVATLPPWIDAKTRDFGDDFYERMEQDPQVASAFHLWKMGVLAQQPQAMCAVKESDPQYALAREYADFCQRAIDRVAGFRSRKLYNLLDGAAYGNKVAEIVLERAASGPDKGQLTLKTLKVKSRRVLAFVVDAYMNVIGLVAAIPGKAGNLSLAIPMVWSGFGGTANLLPRERFCVFTYRGQDEDPRGQSFLAPVYPAWWGKLQLYPEYLKYLAQFADPSLWGTTAENAQAQYPTDSTGAIQINAAPISPTVALVQSMEGIRNGSVIGLPFGAAIHALEMQGNGEPFLKAYEYFNNEIAKGILGSTLATEQSMHGSRAQSQVHQDAVGLSIGHGRNLLEEMIEFDLFRYLIRLRYGEEALALCPKVSLGEVQEEDKAAMAKSAAALLATGKITPSHYVYLMTELLGFPSPTPEEVKTITAGFELGAMPPPAPGDPNEPDADDGEDNPDAES